MPPLFSVALVVIAVALFATRFTLRAVPLGSRKRAFTYLDLALVTIGTVGLVPHCGAMFYRSALAAVPGSAGYITAVNQMGTASVVLYVIPAALVLIGLRRQQPVVVALLGLSFIAVGVTMYNHGPLNTHLAAIFASGVVLAATLALFVSRPNTAKAAPAATRSVRRQ